MSLPLADSAHKNEQEAFTVSLDDSSSLLLHLLPKGFVRIRNFGSWQSSMCLSGRLLHLLGARRPAGRLKIRWLRTALALFSQVWRTDGIVEGSRLQKSNVALHLAHFLPHENASRQP